MRLPNFWSVLPEVLFIYSVPINNSQKRTMFFLLNEYCCVLRTPVTSLNKTGIKAQFVALFQITTTELFSHFIMIWRGIDNAPWKPL